MATSSVDDNGGGGERTNDAAEAAAAAAAATATVVGHPYDFHVSGPRNLSSPNWRDLIRSSWFDFPILLLLLILKLYHFDRHLHFVFLFFFFVFNQFSFDSSLDLATWLLRIWHFRVLSIFRVSPLLLYFGLFLLRINTKKRIGNCEFKILLDCFCLISFNAMQFIASKIVSCHLFQLCETLLPFSIVLHI